MTADQTSTDAAAGTGTMRAVDGFDEWMRLARVSYQRLADAFAAVPEDAWGRPTPCEGWTVRDLAGHAVGSLRSAATLRETASQQLATARRARRTGEQIDVAMTAIQLERTASLTVAEVVAELQGSVDRAVAGRRRMPAPLRRLVRIPVEMGTISERWSLDYFLGTILTRDAWLHRIDLADALGVAPTLDADDAAIVGDVAVEWARRHGQPVTLVLTGPAGGTLVAGDGGDRIEVDAVEFCRVVSVRSTHPHPLMAQAVPF